MDNNISILLYGGSALGAVRHQGFIPWDDDLDLCIERKDYYEFLDAFRRRYGDKYWIHTPQETSNYGLLMTKIILRGPQLKDLEDFENPESGVFVDLFVLDNLFANPLLRKMQCVASYAFMGIVSCVRVNRDSKYLLQIIEDEEAKKILRFKSRLGKVLSIISLDKWTSMTDKLFQVCKDNESKYVAIFPSKKSIGGYYWERTFFGVGEKCAFEGHEWLVPAKVKEFLLEYYGDYMRIPPPEEREQHAYIEIGF